MASSAIKGITIEIGGDTTKLGDALGDLGRQSGDLGRELSQIEKALKFNPDNVELLGQKQKYASERAEVLQQRLEAVNAALGSGQVEEGSRAYDQLTREVIVTTSKLDQMRSASSDAQTRIEQLSSAATQAARASGDLDEALDASDIDDIGDAAEESADSVKSFGDAIKDALNNSQTAKGIFEGGLYAIGEDAVDAAKELVSSAAEVSRAWDDASAKIRASVGDDTEAARQLQDVGRDLYDNGWGDSVESITESVMTARQVLGDLSDEDLGTVTTAAETLSSVFDSDISESLRGINVLMDKFGLSATQASDLLVAGSQRGLDYTDELGDNLSEYSGRWAEAGTSASEYFSLLQAGVDAGAYSLDKVGDYLNEFLTSLSDGRMETAITGFSDSTQDVWESYKAGGATAQDMLNAVVGELSNCTSETERLQKSSELWSSLGEDNAWGMIAALANVKDSYTDVAGTAQQAADDLSDDLSTRLETLKRQGIEALLPALDIAVDALSAMAGAVTPLVEDFNGLDGKTRAVVAASALAAAALPKVTKAIKELRAASEATGAAKLADDISLVSGEASAARDGVSALGDAERVASTSTKALSGAMKALKGVGVAAAAAIAADVVVDLAQRFDEARERGERLSELSDGVAGSLARIGQADVEPQGLDALVDSVTSIADEAGAVTDDVVSDFEDIKRSQADLQTQFASLDSAVATIDELAGSCDGSAVKERELEAAVKLYNSTTGDSVEVTDKVTGALSKSTTDIDANTKAWKENAEAQANKEAYQSFYVDLQKAKAQTQELSDAYDEAKKAAEEFREQNHVIDAAVPIALDSGTATRYKDLRDAADAAGKAVEDNQAAIEGLQKSLDALDAQMDETSSGSTSLIEMFDDLGDATQGTRDYVDSIDLDGLSGELESLGVTADALADATEGDLWSIMRAWQSSGGSADALKGKLDELGIAWNDQGQDAADAAEVMTDAADTAQGALEGAFGSMRGTSFDEVTGGLDDVTMGLGRAAAAMETVSLEGGTVESMASEVNSALKDVGIITNDLTAAQVLYAYQTGKTGDELAEYARGCDDANKAQQDAEQSAQDAAKATDELHDSMEELASSNDFLAQRIEASGQTLDGFADELAATGSGVDDLKGQLDSLGDVSNPIEHVDQAMIDDVVVTSDTMLGIMSDNINNVSAWSDNMMTLYSSATDAQQVQFLDYLNSLGPEYSAVVDELIADAQSGGTLLQQMSDAYATQQEANQNTVVDNAQARADKIRELGIDEGAQAGAAQADAQSQAYEQGMDSGEISTGDASRAAAEIQTQAYIAQIDADRDGVVDATGQSVDDAVAQARERGELGGSDAGGAVAGGIASGIEGSGDQISAAATEAADQVTGPMDDLTSQMEERGRLAATNFAYGFEHADVALDAVDLSGALDGVGQQVEDAGKAAGGRLVVGIESGIGESGNVDTKLVGLKIQGADGGLLPQQVEDAGRYAGGRLVPGVQAGIDEGGSIDLGGVAQAMGPGVLDETMRNAGRYAGGQLVSGVQEGVDAASLPGSIDTSAVGTAIQGVEGGVLPQQVHDAGQTAGGMLVPGINDGIAASSTPGAVDVSPALSGVSDACGQAGADAGAALSTALAESTSGVPDAMGAVGGSSGEYFANGVALNQGNVSGAGRSLESALGLAVANTPNAMSVTGVLAGSNLAGGVSSAWQPTYDAAASLNSAAQQGIGSDFRWAYGSGSELGGNFADGIRSQVGAVSSAAWAAAQAASDPLHHSTPKVGPLRDDDAWGLHMMMNIADGMNAGIPAVEDEAQRAARAMARANETIGAAWPNQAAPSASAAMATYSQSTTYNVRLGDMNSREEIRQLTEEYVTEVMRALER